MPGTMFSLTPTPRTLTAAAVQDPKEALEVLSSNGRIDLMLRVYQISGSTPNVTVTVETSMYREEDLWVPAGTFDVISSSTLPPVVALTLTAPVLRYIRYSAVGTFTSVTFDLTGVAW